MCFRFPETWHRGCKAGGFGMWRRVPFQYLHELFDPIFWKCVHGHQWTATFAAVKCTGTWCPVCAKSRQRLGLEIAQEVAASNGGLCLSISYKGNQSPLLWRCASGHEWAIGLKSVRGTGRWCPQCEERCVDLQTAQRVAVALGGECLSTEYRNNHTPLRWCCHLGHEWTSSLNNVKDAGSWCPQCSSKKTERKVREMCLSQMDPRAASPFL